MSLSPNVNKVAEQQAEAKDAVDNLRDQLLKEKAVHTAYFEGSISDTLKAMNISDANPAGENSYVRIEYTAEFSLDAIAEIVKGAIKAAAAVYGSDAEKPAASPEAVEAYLSIVSAVAEAAKTSSSSTSDLSYSATQIGPGTVAFLYAQSIIVKDERLFGSEAISATALYYRIINSVQLIGQSADFKMAINEYYLIDTWQLLREDYINFLRDPESKVGIKECREMQAYAEEELRNCRIRLKRAGLSEKRQTPKAKGFTTSASWSPDLQSKVNAAQERSKEVLAELAKRGGDYAQFAKDNLDRLAAEGA